MEYNGYVGAPYNFIKINKKVNWKNKEELPPHNVIDPELKSGKISYEIEAITPVFVSQGKREDKKAEEFYQNCYGNYAIPGSSVRGLVRSNVQILSSSSVAGDIQDGILMYRNVANGKEKKEYNKILGNSTYQVKGKDGKLNSLSVLKNVKAGYLTREEGKYFILPSVVDRINRERGEMNYYIVSERKIMEGKYKGFEDLKRMQLQNLDRPLDRATGSPFRRKEDRRGGIHYVGETNSQYKPYIREIYYRLKGENQITGIYLARDGVEKKGLKKGYLLSSGPMKEKKVIYVIPQMNENGERIPISPKDIDSYQRDYEGRKNQIETIDKAFFRLPQEGEIKPIFYIHLGSRLYFGFTPRLRLFYEKNIHAGLPIQQKKEGVDYAGSLFGYSNEKESYKSRLSFMDAEVKQDKGKTSEDALLILSGPKPTSYLDYLNGEKGKPVSYNQDFELRGIKQYWLKEKEETGTVGKNEKVAARFRPYEKGTVFKGEIRFTNLTEAELGMVLWGLLLEENSNQNIGMGKPFGYGRIKVRLTQLQILDQEALYGGNSLCLNPYRDETAKKDSYISRIKEELSRLLGKDVMKEQRIKDFFLMKDAGKIPPGDKTRYMKLDLKEYQDRLKSLVCLPSVEAVVKGEKAVIQKGEKQAPGSKGESNRGQRKNDFRGNKNQREDKRAREGSGRSQDFYSGGNASTSMGDMLKGLKLD